MTYLIVRKMLQNYLQVLYRNIPTFTLEEQDCKGLERDARASAGIRRATYPLK